MKATKKPKPPAPFRTDSLNWPAARVQKRMPRERKRVEVTRVVLNVAIQRQKVCSQGGGKHKLSQGGTR